MDFLNISVLRDYLSRIPYPPSNYYHFDTTSDTDSDINMEGPSSEPPPRNGRIEESQAEAASYIPPSAGHVYPQTPKKQTHPYQPLSLQTNTKTPMRPSMQNAILTDEGVCDADVKAFIEQEFKLHVIRDYPIADFVAQVWKFDSSKLPPLPDGESYSLSGGLCSDYITAKQYLKTRQDDGLIKLHQFAETRACHIFESLFRHTAKSLVDYWNRYDPGKASEIEKDRFRGTLKFLQESIVTGNYAKFKPDFANVADGSKEPSLDTIFWEAIGYFAELKKRSKVKDSGIGNDVIIDLKNIPTVAPTACNLRATPSAEQPAISDSHSRKRSRVDSNPALQDRPFKQHRSRTPASQRGTKQEGPPRIPDPDNIDDCPGFTHNEVQAIKYLNELISHGIRNYASGFLVEDQKLSLWYGDRFGIIKSRYLNLVKEPHYFLLVVAALTHASCFDLGFCPLVRKIPRDSLSYATASLRVPSALDVTGQDLGNLEFALNVSGKKPINTSYGTMGRGTTVIPILASGRSLELFGGDRLVAKISWQPVKRNEEGNIRRVRTRLAHATQFEAREALKYIVDFKCSTSLAIDNPDVGLPRVFMSHIPAIDEQDLRDFRVMVMKEYLPLQLIDTPEELQLVFRHSVTGHHWAWQVAGVLHRDVSVTNIMFYRTPNGIVGVLCDWDLSDTKEDIGEEKPLAVDHKGLQAVEESARCEAAHANIDMPSARPVDDESAHKRKARYRTGTGPFMALDLLSPGPTPIHLYRHDLESFFWVLAYFIIAHNPEQHTIGRVNEWTGSNLKTVGDNKREFLLDPNAKKRVVNKAHTRYTNFIHRVLWRLQLMFVKVEGKVSQIRASRVAYMDAIATGDKEEEVSVAKDLIDICRDRNERATFDGFMLLLTRPIG
ncbi:hypothetical protein QCA50_010351 [Cerrena zonata]|uniref:Fungal-type protein kinase domain-containing protein n=1 Tax=Cerrena zonata TaxID=2478898 RepID=A0AAW0G0J1_9APHY